MRNELKWSMVMKPEAANKIAAWDGSGNPILLDSSAIGTEHFKGTYATLAALEAAHPTAAAGDYATVDPGAGNLLETFVYDTSDAKWIFSAGGDIGYYGRGYWRFNTTTTSGPASGTFRFDNATIGSITKIYLHEVSDESADISLFLPQLGVGDKIFIQQKNDATRWFKCFLNAPPTDQGASWELPITLESSGGILPVGNSPCLIRIVLGSATVTLTSSNGIQIVSSDIRLGGTPISLATVLDITTGSLAITGANKPFTLKSTSGFQPKLQIQGDGVNTDGRNYEWEPQLISGFVRGLLLKYSTAHNTAADQPAIFVRDNGWIYWGATNENGAHMIYRHPSTSLAIGSNIQSIQTNDLIHGNGISNLGTQGRNILKGQNYNLKGASLGNFIYADTPDNSATSMNELISNFINGLDAACFVQKLSASLLLGGSYKVNQASNEFQTLYNILMGNYNEMSNSHHLFQFGTGLKNLYTTALHALWRFQPKFYFGNCNIEPVSAKAVFVIANGFVSNGSRADAGSRQSHSFTHLTNGWTQINTTNDGFQGGITNLTESDITPKAPLEVVSTTGGFIPPKMTTTQRNAIATPPDGSVLYNITTNKLTLRENGAWVELGAATAPVMREVFAFNSSLYTEDAKMFRGVLASLSGYSSAELSAISFEARLDSTSTWTVIADLTALQTWITSNITGTITSGTKFWVKVLATYGASSSGLAQYVLHYTS